MDGTFPGQEVLGCLRQREEARTHLFLSAPDSGHDWLLEFLPWFSLSGGL